MEINKKKFLIDLLMFIDFLILALSGFILWIGYRSLFFLQRGYWRYIHSWAALIIVILILIHLILNLNWIKCMLKV